MSNINLNQERDNRRTPSPPYAVAPQHIYTSGIPGPPRILIPPNVPPHPLTNPNPAPGSTSHLDPQNCTPLGLAVLLGCPSSLQDWTYDCRRQAQQVLPWVWLGSLAAIRNKHLLASRGITMLLCVRSSLTAAANFMGGGAAASNASTPLQPRLGTIDDPVRVNIDLPSSPGAPLIATFRSAAQLIDRNYLSTLIPNHLPTLGSTSEFPDYHSRVFAHCTQYQYSPLPGEPPVIEHALNPYPPNAPRPGSTLVFCETGNENAAVVVASYIMHHYEASLIQACQLVQCRRFSVAFDDTMKYALDAWEPILKSYREVQRAHIDEGVRVAGSGCVTKKRGFGESDSSEMVSEEENILPETRRYGTAPFRDPDDDKDDFMTDVDVDEGINPN